MREEQSIFQKGLDLVPLISDEDLDTLSCEDSDIFRLIQLLEEFISFLTELVELGYVKVNNFNILLELCIIEDFFLQFELVLPWVTNHSDVLGLCRVVRLRSAARFQGLTAERGAFQVRADDKPRV